MWRPGLRTAAGWERVVWSSFMPEAEFSQTASVAGLRVDPSRTIGADNPLQRHVFRFGRDKGPSTLSSPPPKVHTATKSPILESLNLAPNSNAVSEPCSKRNIILRWLITSRARALFVRNAGLGSWLGSKPKLEKTRKDLERSAPRRSAARNSNSKLARPGFLTCLYPFSSVATSICRNCLDCSPKDRRIACSRRSILSLVRLLSHAPLQFLEPDPRPCAMNHAPEES
jgi:hypothetical protein